MENSQPKFNDWYINDAPKKLDDIFGQDTIVKYLKPKFKNRSFDKSIMFQGNFGSGKTAIAKILAKSIACKNINENGEPCEVCPTCLAINNETYNRDVIYLNGEKMSAAEVDDILNKVFLTPAIRDAAKILICDETQGFSPQAIQKFLAETQSPKQGVYFIFTAMSKLQGKNPGALESRCKVWKMKVPKNEEVYQYLANICMKKKLAISKEFAGEGLKFISENCNSSFRKAIQMLQQCYEGQIFEIEKIKETFDIVSYDDAALILADLANGKLTEDIFDVINGTDYQDKFGLLIKIIGDAATYRTFGTQFVEDNEKWKWSNPKKVSEGRYFDKLCYVFQSLSKNAYIKRGEWQLEISNYLYEVSKINKQREMIGVTEETEKILIDKLVKRKPITF